MRSSNKGHPWSDESEGEGSSTTTKNYSIGPFDTTESEATTRRSTRMYIFLSFLIIIVVVVLFLLKHLFLKIVKILILNLHLLLLL